MQSVSAQPFKRQNPMKCEDHAVKLKVESQDGSASSATKRGSWATPPASSMPTFLPSADSTYQRSRSGLLPLMDCYERTQAEQDQGATASKLKFPLQDPASWLRWSSSCTCQPGTPA